MLVGLVVAPEVACEACEASFAVARFADALPCPACGEAAAVGVACLAGELGDEALLRPPFDDPCCPWCDAAFALADVDVQLARGAIACPGCGVALPVRPAPAPLPASGIAYLIGEDLGGGAEAQPTIFRCPGCGGELEAAAGSRTRCAYCTAEVHLPRRARGGDRAHGWIVAFDPASLGPALAAAGDATTATDALTALAWHVVATVRRQVAANPATLDVALARLAADADDGVRAAVVANPATAVATLVELARTDGGAAAASARLPAAVIDELAASPQAWVRGAVAANPAAPGACLSRLAADATPEVRAAVAANPAAPAARSPRSRPTARPGPAARSRPTRRRRRRRARGARRGPRRRARRHQRARAHRRAGRRAARGARRPGRQSPGGGAPRGGAPSRHHAGGAQAPGEGSRWPGRVRGHAQSGVSAVVATPLVASPRTWLRRGGAGGAALGGVGAAGREEHQGAEGGAIVAGDGGVSEVRGPAATRARRTWPTWSYAARSRAAASGTSTRRPVLTS
ncbi:MAG: hypothetical protein IPL61_08355 [Myxococcales bacterium]|nr:hypothetical protein [Myxococcales bacterium]